MMKKILSFFLMLSILLLALTACGEPPKPLESSFFSAERVTASDRYEDAAYADFYDAATETAVIPGLKQGFIPQGMDLCEKDGILYISGYFKSQKQSRSSVLLAVSAEGGYLVGEYWLKKPDTTYLTGHVGGVAVTEKNVFIANGGSLYRYPLTDVHALEGMGTLTAKEAIKTPTAASFCNYADGILYVGDFYLMPNYTTPEWRHTRDKNGNAYGAWCAAYALTEENESELTAEALSGIAYAIPSFIYALDTKVQGFTALKDTVVLSRSHGRTNDACLSFYSISRSMPPDQTVSLEGKEIPFYFLSPERLEKTIVTPPMTEGVCTDGRGYYLLFESAASYYMDGGGKNPVDRIYYLKNKWFSTMP